MKMDRARIQIGRLSRFGLLEMSRQRLRPSLGESSHLVCPRCVGIGSIRSIESMALSILRLIGEELRKDRTARVIVQVPVDVATYLINEKREWLRALEDKSATELIIVPNQHMQTPEYSIRRVRDDEMELPENKQASYLHAGGARGRGARPRPGPQARTSRLPRWPRCCRRLPRRLGAPAGSAGSGGCAGGRRRSRRRWWLLVTLQEDAGRRAGSGGRRAGAAPAAPLPARGAAPRRRPRRDGRGASRPRPSRYGRRRAARSWRRTPQRRA